MYKLAFACFLAGMTLNVQAKVDPSQAARLGNDLTPQGGERAGSPDGLIPPWNGGITRPHAGYQKGMHHPDPFSNDQP